MKKSGFEIQAEAIVLRSRTSGEDDLLVEFLTPEGGRLTGIARHGRKSRKRFGTVLEALQIVRLRYQDRGGLVSLREAAMEIPLSRLTDDWGRLMPAFYLVDVIRKSIHERSPDRRLYALLKKSLKDLNEKIPPGRVLLNFEDAFLDLSGYGPSLEKCLRCGKPWQEEQSFYFVFQEGGIFCRDCLPAGAAHERYSPKSFALILPRFIEYQIGRPLQSRKFLTPAPFSA